MIGPVLCLVFFLKSPQVLSFKCSLSSLNALFLQVEKGYRMPQPITCPTVIYNIMLECWKKEETERPTFESLQFRLEDLFLEEGTSYLEAERVQ